MGIDTSKAGATVGAGSQAALAHHILLSGPPFGGK